MKTITIAQIAKAINCADKSLLENSTPITGICTDSRTVKPGDCFFAIKGKNFDGHDHVPQALQNGAACAVTSQPTNATPTIQTADTVIALGNLAKWYRSELPCKLIAITGSAGKTTTRQMIYAALSAKYNCSQAQKSFNNEIGLPLTILHADLDCQYLITEIGTNAPGEIAHLSKIANPDIAIITNVFPAHLEGFGSVEAILKEKASITQGLKSDGQLIINADIPNLLKHCKTLTPNITTFSQKNPADIQAAKLNPYQTSGTIEIENKTIDIPAPGMGNLYNALAAFALCKILGETIDEFAAGIKTFTPTNMRLQIETLGTLTIINDCYNANPASMQNALQCLKSLAPPSNEKVFIAGQMAELGDHAEYYHKQLGIDAADANVNKILATGPQAKLLCNAAREENPKIKTTHYKTTQALCNDLPNQITKNQTILIKGSRSAKLETVIKKLKQLV